MKENSDLLPMLLIRKVRNGYEVMPWCDGHGAIEIGAIRVFNELGWATASDRPNLLAFIEQLFAGEAE